jgi:energy-converting hydrogenase Eha subunit B
MKDPRIPDRDLWDRPSMDMKVRPSKVARDIGRNDLTIVIGPGSPKMLAGTLLAAIGITAILVWPLTTIFMILTGLRAPDDWYWGTVGALTLVFWAALFTLAVHETSADRRYAAQL